MAEKTDDLGQGTNPAPAASSAADPPKTSVPPVLAVPADAAVLPATPKFLRAAGQPAHAEPLPAAASRLERADHPDGRDSTVEPRKLIVGPGISLSGDIASCDRLVVEGNVQANLQNCKSMTIAETGLFDGSASIDDVDVHGRFEGDLVVRKRLLIRASGQVAGTIAYREIEIEPGGRISGSIEASNASTRQY